MQERRRRQERSAGLQHRANVLPGSGDAREALDDCLDHLPESYRMAVIMHYIEGMSLEDCAGRLGIAAGTVGWRLSKARVLMRRRLASGSALPALALLAEQEPAPTHLLQILHAGAHGVSGASAGATVLAAGGGASVLFAAGCTAALVVGLGAGTWSLQHRPTAHPPLPAPQAAASAPAPHHPGRVFHLGGEGGLARFADLPPLQPGDVVELRAGTYIDAHRFLEDGSASDPITITGPEQGTAHILGDGLLLDGDRGRPRGLVQVEGAHYRIANLTMSGARNGHNAAGVLQLKARDCQVQDCVVQDCDVGIGATYGDGIDAVDCTGPHNGLAADQHAHNLVAYECDRVRLIRCTVVDALGENLWSTATDHELVDCLIGNSDGGEIDIAIPEHPMPMGSTMIRGTAIVGKAQRANNAGYFLRVIGPGRELVLINDALVAGSGLQRLVEGGSGTSVTAVDSLFAGTLDVAVGQASWRGAGDAFQLGCLLPQGMVSAGNAPPVPASDLLHWAQSVRLPGGVDPAGFTWPDGRPLLLPARDAADAAGWWIGAGPQRR